LAVLSKSGFKGVQLGKSLDWNIEVLEHGRTLKFIENFVD